MHPMPMKSLKTPVAFQKEIKDQELFARTWKIHRDPGNVAMDTQWPNPDPLSPLHFVQDISTEAKTKRMFCLLEKMQQCSI